MLGSEREAGAYIAPGLPNITGSAAYVVNVGLVDAHNHNTVAGAFTRGQQLLALNVASMNAPAYALKLDAQRSNSIYGASSTVMPSSVNAPVILYLGWPK